MRGLLAALSLLTVFPLRVSKMPPVGSVVVFFPLVGALYGGVVVGWIALARLGNIPQPLVVMGMIGIPLFMSGFLHFDGWCDVWDGFFVSGGKERRLEVMKDSRVGVFGLAMGVSLLLFRYSLYPLVMQQELGIVFSWVLSRTSIVGVAYRAVYPRDNGTGAFLVGRVSFLSWLGVHMQVVALGIFLCWWEGSVRPLLAWGCMQIVVIAMKVLSSRRIGGVTGDVMGATAELVEVMTLLAWVGAR
ncbi:MAG: adenosylcobinamide-GDP ribazoletransferase [Brevinematales bacterium]|nr:adenosylcobinamide-GDP ribazoletransferase [Brevinematales bacterium]